MIVMCIKFVIFFSVQINWGNIEQYTVQNDSNNVSTYLIFIFFSILCKSVGLFKAFTPPGQSPLDDQVRRMTVVIVRLVYFAVFWIIGILYKKSMSLLIIGIIYMNVTFTESIPQSEKISGRQEILGGA